MARADAPAAMLSSPDGDLSEGAAESDDDAGNAAVAHQGVGTDADNGHRHVAGPFGQEIA